MDWTLFVQDYGYIALFAGAFLEGEIALLLASYAARHGDLLLPVAIFTAFVAGTLGDQFYYFLGRRRGRQLLARKPRLRRRALAFRLLLRRHHTPVILGLRFLYGFRMIGAAMIGMSGISPRRFMLLNATGTALWATTLGLTGYLLGDVVNRAFQGLRAYELFAGSAVALAVLLLWLRREKR